MKKRIFTLLLALALIASLMPAALASEEASEPEAIAVIAGETDEAEVPAEEPVAEDEAALPAEDGDGITVTYAVRTDDLPQELIEQIEREGHDLANTAAYDITITGIPDDCTGLTASVTLPYPAGTKGVGFDFSVNCLGDAGHPFLQRWGQSGEGNVDETEDGIVVTFHKTDLFPSIICALVWSDPDGSGEPGSGEPSGDPPSVQQEELSVAFQEVFEASGFEHAAGFVITNNGSRNVGGSFGWDPPRGMAKGETTEFAAYIQQDDGSIVKYEKFAFAEEVGAIELSDIGLAPGETHVMVVWNGWAENGSGEPGSDEPRGLLFNPTLGVPDEDKALIDAAVAANYPGYDAGHTAYYTVQLWNYDEDRAATQKEYDDAIRSAMGDNIIPAAYANLQMSAGHDFIALFLKDDGSVVEIPSTQNIPYTSYSDPEDIRGDGIHFNFGTVGELAITKPTSIAVIWKGGESAVATASSILAGAEENNPSADIDGDGVVTKLDAAALLKQLVGLPVQIH